MIFVGDLHGQRFDLLPPFSIQLGDLDLLGYGRVPTDKDPRFFIEGNHDHFPALNVENEEPYEVKKNLYHIPRGYLVNGVLFIGGGDSIDRPMRISGIDWFPEEALTQNQFDRIMNIEEGVEVVVAHDSPIYHFPVKAGNHRECLKKIFEKHKPKLWINGHLHDSNDVVQQDCRFRTVDINEIFEIEIPITYEDLTREGNQKGKEND